MRNKTDTCFGYTHMWLTVNQCLELWELSTAAKLHLGCDGFDHQFDMCVVLDWGEVEGKRSRADQAAEVVGRRGEEEALLVSCQNVRSHDEEHDGQAEQEAVEPDLAEAAQGVPAPWQLPFHLQDCKQVHGRVVHLQEQWPLAVVVHCGAQQAVFVVHLRHGVNRLRVPGVTAQTQGGVMEQEPARPEVLGWGNGRQLISMMSYGEQATSSTGICLVRGKRVN